MDFKTLTIEIAAACFIVFKRFFSLIIAPYKTLRKISFEKDYLQVFVIFTLVFIYFYTANIFRKSAVHPVFIFVIFFFNFFFTVYFFYFLSKRFEKKARFSSFIFTFSYTLFPTLLWFFANSLIYAVLPPPRNFSFLGSFFSILFIGFSISLLFWKIILVYLAVRFSSQMGFFRIMYSVLLYICVFIPYTLLLYFLGIFRVPFL